MGYGDRYPTTGEGRLVALGLMLTGIALLGVVTAALASWFVERLADAQATGPNETEFIDPGEVHTSPGSGASTGGGTARRAGAGERRR